MRPNKWQGTGRQIVSGDFHVDTIRESTNIIERLDAPPRPRLVMRVGITGHRHLTDPKGIERAISTVFQRIEQVVLQVHTEAQGRYADTPPEVRIVSPIAQGADTIAAEVGIARATASRAGGRAGSAPRARDDRSPTLG